MPRKKDKFLAVEVLETNSTWDYRPSRIIYNFICRKDDAEKVITDMDIYERWKHDKKYTDEVKSILAAPGTRNASNVFFNNEVAVEEVKVPKTVKASDKFIYKVYDYTDGKLSSEYGSKKDVLSYLSKKIKTKYAYTAYNGSEKRIEYSTKVITDILAELEDTTSNLEIEPLARSGNTDCTIFVSIFKNRAGK